MQTVADTHPCQNHPHWTPTKKLGCSTKLLLWLPLIHIPPLKDLKKSPTLEEKAREPPREHRRRRVTWKSGSFSDKRFISKQLSFQQSPDIVKNLLLGWKTKGMKKKAKQGLVYGSLMFFYFDAFGKSIIKGYFVRKRC